MIQENLQSGVGHHNTSCIVLKPFLFMDKYSDEYGVADR